MLLRITMALDIWKNVASHCHTQLIFSFLGAPSRFSTRSLMAYFTAADLGLSKHMLPRSAKICQNKQSSKTFILDIFSGRICLTCGGFAPCFDAFGNLKPSSSVRVHLFARRGELSATSASRSPRHTSGCTPSRRKQPENCIHRSEHLPPQHFQQRLLYSDYPERPTFHDVGEEHIPWSTQC